MEGVWGNNRVSGFIGIDDVTFFEGDCESESSFFLTNDFFPYSLLTFFDKRTKKVQSQ